MRIYDHKGYTICIDHHPRSEEKYDLYLNEATYSSTSEIIYNLFFRGEKKLSKEICEILFLGIWGDTAGFRYTIPKLSGSLEVASRLIREGGIDVENLLSKYDFLSEKEFSMFQNLITNSHILKIKNWPKLMTSFLDRKFFSKDSIQTDGAAVKYADYLKSIKRVDWGFVVYPQNDTCSISFRSRYNSVDVRDLAVRMGIGSGMHWASGGRLEMIDPEKGVKVVIGWLEKNNPKFYKI